VSGWHQHKIALLLDGLEASTAGGTERQALMLAGWLREAGYDVSIYVFRGHELSPGSPIHNLRYRSCWRPSSLLRLLRFANTLRKQRVCALQSFFVEANLLGPVVARLAGVLVVLGSRRNVNHWMGSVFARLQQASNLLSTAIIANSEAVKSATSEIERTATGKITVQYNGVDVAAFANAVGQRARVRSEWKLPDDAIAVGVVATLRPVKGIDVFLESAVAIAARNDRAHFVVIGDGPYRAQLEGQAKTAGLTDRVHFQGASNDVPTVLAGLDIAVLPSRSEGFSNALLEYMAAGLPIVATNVGGNAEALEGTGGLLVSPADATALADAIMRFIDSSAERTRVGEQTRKRAREVFDIATAKQRTLDFYADLLRAHCVRSQPGD
jgi:glycosyltransferase involved in cell wall biosynthesis